MKNEFRSIKKISREKFQFDILDLYDNVGRTQHFKLGDPNSEKIFREKISESLLSMNSDTLIYGRHTEEMFAHVIAALANCSLIKKEDAGELFSDDDDILIPDYRVILKDKRQIFVEVKNHHDTCGKKKYILKKVYYEKLLKYADICEYDLYFAIFWSSWHMWTLVNIDDFDVKEKSFTITFEKAVKCNKMSLFRDMTIATLCPLSARLYLNQETSDCVHFDRNVKFEISKVELYCQNKIIHSKLEQQIASMLMMYGEWNNEEVTCVLDESTNKINYMEFNYYPHDMNEDNGFSIVGILSQIISRQYIYHTASTAGIYSISPYASQEPFGVIIPDDYKGEVLPLWRFIQSHNNEEDIKK